MFRILKCLSKKFFFCIINYFVSSAHEFSLYFNHKCTTTPNHFLSYKNKFLFINQYFCLIIFSVGVKLRLIKSNSCASRLELTGTHLDENQLNRNNSVSSFDPEESVRTIIRRIESNSFNSKKVPRIIESKCIEKTNDSKSKQIQFQFGKSTDAILANQTTKNGSLGPIEILSQVSVNNHINNINAAVSTDKPPQKSNVISRNRNVDLALELSKNPTSKNVVVATTKLPKDKLNSIKNGDTNENGEISSNPPKAKIIDNEALQNIMVDLNAAIAKQQASEDQSNGGKLNQQQQSPKMIKWETVSVFDEKNYIANDISLKQKPKYDEIEFEEYEVIDPHT